MGVETLDINTLQLYPNPVNNKLVVTGTGANGNDASATVFDITGQIVQESNTNEAGKFILNTSELPAGIYFVRVSSAGKTAGAKFVKE